MIELYFPSTFQSIRKNSLIFTYTHIDIYIYVIYMEFYADKYFILIPSVRRWEILNRRWSPSVLSESFKYYDWKTV